MSMPLVSIVIPCYRQAEFLPHAIDAALSQSYSAVEAIVIDDGSDDDTAAVARRYGDRIRFVSQANGGASSARNAGLRIARGEYVLFLDADDYLHLDSIARLVQIMDGASRRLAMMGCVKIAADDSVTIPAPQATEPFPWILGTNHPIHAILAPRSLIAEAGGFDESIKTNEDWDLWLRMSLLGIDVVSTSFVGAYYRRTPNSLSSDSGRMALSFAEVLQRLVERVVDDANFLARHGSELLRAIYGSRRRLRLNRLGADLEDKFNQAIAAIHRRGVYVKAPWQVKLQDRLPRVLGDWLEDLGLAYYRWRRPEFFRAMKD